MRDEGCRKRDFILVLPFSSFARPLPRPPPQYRERVCGRGRSTELAEVRGEGTGGTLNYLVRLHPDLPIAGVDQAGVEALAVERYGDGVGEAELDLVSGHRRVQLQLLHRLLCRVRQ